MSETVTLTREAYDELLARIEDLEASLALERARQQDDGTRIPLDVVKAEIAGAHPVQAWREHHGLSHEALAGKAGLTTGAVGAIERGESGPDDATAAALAQALGVAADLLSRP